MEIKKIFKESLLTLIVISWTSISYALLTDLEVNNWETITASIWNNLVQHSTPSWAVMAFDLESCPNWWTEYIQLQWRFIRWADTAANNDPDFDSRTWWVWDRKIWSIQDDEVWAHNHSMTVPKWSSSYTATSNIYYSPNWATASLKLNTDLSNWTETRPKNVYLLYCKKD